MAHAAHGPRTNGPGLDNHQRLSIFGNFFKGETIGMILQGFSSMAQKSSIWMCRNGFPAIFWSCFAMELLPELPTPLRRMI